MNYRLNRHYLTQRFGKIILSLFVLSVINMSMQLPAHAAMKMSMQTIMPSSMDMSDMSDCHCPPALCDTVIAFDNQSVGGLLSFDWPVTKSAANLIEVLDQHQGQLNQRQHYSFIQLHSLQHSPPPLLIKTLLLI